MSESERGEGSGRDLTVLVVTLSASAVLLVWEFLKEITFNQTSKVTDVLAKLVLKCF